MVRTSLIVGILALGLAGLAACSSGGSGGRFAGGSGSGKYVKTSVKGLRPCPLSQVNPSNLRLPCKKIGGKWYVVD